MSTDDREPVADALFGAAFPTSARGGALDAYLAAGWFRGGPFLGYFRVICLNGDVYAVRQVRVRLEGHDFSRSLRRLLRRNGDRFRVQVGPPKIDAERERLYALTATRFSGFMHSTLEGMLFPEDLPSIFETRELAVFSGDELVAVSYFDIGGNSVAGLIGLYDDHFARHSLGIYTMLMEIEWSKERGLDYYYPGFVLHGDPRMDYKLRSGNMQFMEPGRRWRPLAQMPGRSRLVQRIRSCVTAAELALAGLDVPVTRRAYPFFYLADIDFLPGDFVSAPLVVECHPGETRNSRLLVEYLHTRDVYLLSSVEPVPDAEEIAEGEPTREMIENEAYLREPLIRVQRFLETRDLGKLARKAKEIGPLFDGSFRRSRPR